MRAAKEGSMEGARMVSKINGFSIVVLCFQLASYDFPMCPPYGFLSVFLLFCLLFANVSLLFPKVFLLCIFVSYDCIWFP